MKLKLLLVPFVIGHAVCADGRTIDDSNLVAQKNTERKVGIEEEVVVSATRSESLHWGLSKSLSLLDDNSLSLQAHVHVQESLNRLPGVYFHRNSGQEYLPAIRSPIFTGAGACGNFLIAEDGIPLRPAGFCNVNELFEAHTEQAQRIEVIRGSGTSVYGSNALHGVVNVISPAQFNSSNTLRFDLGSDEYQRVKLAEGGESFAASFTGVHDGGYRDDFNLDQQKLSLRTQLDTNRYRVVSGLSAMNLNQETAGFITGANAYKDKELSKANTNPEAYRDAQAVRLWSEWSNATSESKLHNSPIWTIKPYARHSQMNFLQHFLPGDPLEKNGQNSIGMQSMLQFNPKEWKNHDISVGLDIEVVDAWLEQSQDQPTQGSDFLRETIPEGKHYDYEVQAIQLATFLQWQWQASKKLAMTFGARYELMEYDYENLMLSGRTREDGSECGFGGCRYSRPSDRSDSYQNVSPQVGLVYGLSDDQKFFANVGRAFRAPQATELYRLQRGQSEADLDSVIMDSIELGVRGRWQEAWRYELVAYAMDKENVIFRDSDFFNISEGKTQHRGIEFSSSYESKTGWQYGASFSYARHTYAFHRVVNDIDLDGNDVDTAPSLFGSFDLSKQFTPSLRAALNWQFVGKYYTDPENLHEYEGHDLVNFVSVWQIHSNLQSSLQVKNLMDTRYANRADFTSFSGDRYIPGRERSFLVGLELNW